MGDFSEFPEDIIRLLFNHDATALLLRLTCKSFFKYDNPRAEFFKFPKTLLTDGLLELISRSNNHVITNLFSYFKTKIYHWKCNSFIQMAAQNNNHEFISTYIGNLDNRYLKYVWYDLRETWEIAAEKGYMDVLDLIPLEESMKFYVYDHIMCGAAKSANINVYKKYQQKFKVCTRERYLAALNGHFDYLKMIMSNTAGKFYGGEIVEGAARGGHLEIIKWGISIGCPLTANAVSLAAEGGHLEVLKWLKAHDCPWNDSIIETARKCGYNDIIKWVLENDYPSESTPNG